MHIPYICIYVPMLVCRIKHIPYVTQFELRFYARYTTRVLTNYITCIYISHAKGRLQKRRRKRSLSLHLSRVLYEVFIHHPFRFGV